MVVYSLQVEISPSCAHRAMNIAYRCSRALLDYSMGYDDDRVMTLLRVPKRKQAIRVTSMMRSEFPDVLVQFLEQLCVRRVLGFPHGKQDLLPRIVVKCFDEVCRGGKKLDPKSRSHARPCKYTRFLFGKQVSVNALWMYGAAMEITMGR